MGPYPGAVARGEHFVEKIVGLVVGLEPCHRGLDQARRRNYLAGPRGSLIELCAPRALTAPSFSPPSSEPRRSDQDKDSSYQLTESEIFAKKKPAAERDPDGDDHLQE